MPQPSVGSLFIFLNNLCNMACPNCFTPLSHSGIKPHRLEWEDLKAALDLYISQPLGGLPKNIVVIGGEPFLSFPMLVKAIEYLDTKTSPPPMEIFTNGSIIDKKKYEQIRRDWLKLYISIDGDKAGNDTYRVFVNSKNSVYDAVMPRLEELPRNELGIFVVMHPHNLTGLMNAVTGFYNRGFGSIDFCIDMIEKWTPDDIKNLHAFSAAFASFFVERTQRDGRLPFTCEMIEQSIVVGNSIARGDAWWVNTGELILGADGHYYACEGAPHYAYENIASKLSLSRARDGEPNWEQRQSYLEKADKYLMSLGAQKRWQILSPRIFYTEGQIEGKDSREHLEMFQDFSEAFLVELLRIASRLQDHPAFQKHYLKTPADAR